MMAATTSRTMPSGLPRPTTKAAMRARGGDDEQAQLFVCGSHVGGHDGGLLGEWCDTAWTGGGPSGIPVRCDLCLGQARPSEFR